MTEIKNERQCPYSFFSMFFCPDSGFSLRQLGGLFQLKYVFDQTLSAVTQIYSVF